MKPESKLLIPESFSNKDVYEFLVKECKNYPELWDEFGQGILSHTTDVEFWTSLIEHLDCFRVCEECGKPMIEGYVVDGSETYCSKECLHKHITEEEFNDLYNDGEGDTYWTTWYEDSLTFKACNR